jgi:ribulose-5-phosphate 4-epimerase/fuculose-1-phosphate aldolase
MRSTTTQDEFEIRTRMVKIARLMLERGFVKGTEGNVSVRLGMSDRFLITPSNTPYEGLMPPDLALCSLDCEHLAGEKQPSIEIPMHAAVYCARPDVTAIIPTPSPRAPDVAALGESVRLRVESASEAMGNDSIPCSAFAPQGSSELAENVVAALGSENKGLLLTDHGTLAVGSSLEEAFAISELIEEASDRFLRSRPSGAGAD